MSTSRLAILATFLICLAAAVAAGSALHAGIRNEPSTGREEALFATEVDEDVLLAVDPSTATTTLIGSVAAPVVSSLAYDESSGMLFATASSDLVVIDPLQGNITVVGPMGTDNAHGAAIDPADGSLYVVSAIYSSREFPSFLYAVDKLSGASSLIGPIGFNDVDGLDFDPTTGVLYGATAHVEGGDVLLTIDTSTGEGTLVGSTCRLTALSFDSGGQLYGADNGLYASSPSSLYLIDKNDGSHALVGTMCEGNVLGLVFGGNASPVAGTSWTGIKAMFR